MELLITRLDKELRILDREASLAAKSGKIPINNQATILTEYIKLTTTEGIIPAIQYIVLDGLARKFDLYQDDRERSQILSAMGDELTSSSESEILVSIQIVQYTYPVLYHNSRELMDLSQKRAIEQLTKIPITESSLTDTYTAKNLDKEIISRTDRSSLLVPTESVISIENKRSKRVAVDREHPLASIKSSTTAVTSSKFYIYTLNTLKWLTIAIWFVLKWSAVICLSILAFMFTFVGSMLG